MLKRDSISAYFREQYKHQQTPLNKMICNKEVNYRLRNVKEFLREMWKREMWKLSVLTQTEGNETGEYIS